MSGYDPPPPGPPQEGDPPPPGPPQGGDPPPPPGWGPPGQPPPTQPPPAHPWGQPPPPPGWGQAPQAYPQPGYGYGYAPPQTDSSAIVALVLAIASFVICPTIPAIVALFVANTAEASIRASGGAKTGDGLVKAARIVSWINLGLSAAAILGTVLLIIVAAASSS